MIRKKWDYFPRVDLSNCLPPANAINATITEVDASTELFTTKSVIATAPPIPSAIYTEIFGFLSSFSMLMIRHSIVG